MRCFPSLILLRAPASFVGYDGIQYLLDNWNKETFKKCGVDGQVALRDECDRDANKVPAVLGLKSTDAPLFKVERSFKAVLLSGDIDDMDKWTEATDAFVQHATSAQEYAYTASFGEHDGGVRHETGHLVVTGGPGSPGARLASNRIDRPVRRAGTTPRAARTRSPSTWTCPRTSWSSRGMRSGTS